MVRRQDCSECGSFDTERVNVEWHSDMVEETRICNECPSEFTNRFELFDKMGLEHYQRPDWGGEE